MRWLLFSLPFFLLKQGGNNSSATNVWCAPGRQGEYWVQFAVMIIVLILLFSFWLPWSLGLMDTYHGRSLFWCKVNNAKVLNVFTNLNHGLYAQKTWYLFQYRLYMENHIQSELTQFIQNAHGMSEFCVNCFITLFKWPISICSCVTCPSKSHFLMRPREFCSTCLLIMQHPATSTGLVLHDMIRNVFKCI